MKPYYNQKFGNAGALYSLGRSAKEDLNAARTMVAHILSAKQNEITFTGGGTESINLAILGYCRAHRIQDNAKSLGHIITTNFEHPAVLESCRQLIKEGYEVTYLPVDSHGLIQADDVTRAIRPNTILVTIMYANNEIGTILPIVAIGKSLQTVNRQRMADGLPNIAFHTDACQAGEYLSLAVNSLGVDMLTLNGSKIYGPKGIGVLYHRQCLKIEPIIFGGGQENGLRSGTENIASAIGFAKALEIAQLSRKGSKVLIGLRDYMIAEITKRIDNVILNGDAKLRLPNNVNFSIGGIEGESAVLYLDAKGIACSTGSACSAIHLEPSHVILAIGRSHELAHGSLRFTLGRETTKSDIDTTVKELTAIVKRLRSMSPVNIKVK